MSGNAADEEKQRRLLEGEKLRLEVGKLQGDISAWSRFAAVMIPIAVGVIGVAQTYLVWSDMGTKDAREIRDLKLKQIENGMKLVEFATAEATHVTSPDRDEAKLTITYVSTMLPPDMACQMLSALMLSVRVSNDLSDYAATMRTQIAMQTRLAQGTSPLSSTGNPRDRQDQAIIAIATEPGRSAPAAAPMARPAATSSSCPAPAPHGDATLVVYYQIVRKQDREMASAIGSQMPAQFPSAGIEYVPEPDPSKQHPDVRYYYTDQETDARYLACLLTSAYAVVVHDSAVQFGVTSLANPSKHLPAKRVEVWFPPMIHS